MFKRRLTILRGAELLPTSEKVLMMRWNERLPIWVTRVTLLGAERVLAHRY